jgi:hypothetical protein
MACLLALLTAGCASTPPDDAVRERLDEATGATITSLREPQCYFSDEPALAANARDYLYIGPLELNQSGRRTYWLWIGVWSTIDRAVADGEGSRPVLERVQVMADGQPMDLDFAAADVAVPGMRLAPYATPAPAEPAAFIPVTRSQLLGIARAREIRVRTGSAGGLWREWQPWAPHGDEWQRLARRLDGNPGPQSVTMTNE